jgi:hypothetical protein
MRGTGNRNAWMWVAIAAMTFAALSRTEADLLNTKAGAHPVLAFLIKSQSTTASANPAASLHLSRMAGRTSRSASQAAGIYASASMLPVFFVGLLVPLTLFCVAFSRSSGRTPCAPSLAASFQRPPPQLA